MPITFALVDGMVVSAVDRVKAKRHTRLARLRDVAADPRVGLLADHYDDVWSQLWWVRVDAVAELHTDGELYRRAIAALVAKYPPYAAEPPDGDVLVLAPTRWTGWSNACPQGRFRRQTWPATLSWISGYEPQQTARCDSSSAYAKSVRICQQCVYGIAVGICLRGRK